MDEEQNNPLKNPQENNNIINHNYIAHNPHNKKNHKKETCRIFCDWTTQILLYIFIILLIIAIIKKHQEMIIITATGAGCFYIVYFILSLTHPIFFYLSTLQKSETIHNKMKEYYYSNIEWTMKINCYHIEFYEIFEKNSDGSTTRRQKQRRVTTFERDEEFKYFSIRDISGMFLLDIEESLKDKYKLFIKLELDYIIDFADHQTGMDYDNFKRNFIEIYKNQDQYYEIFENKKIPSFEKYNLVKISSEEIPFWFNSCVYVFFSLQIIFD